MYVAYSGWSKAYGSFFCNIYIDETRQDFSLLYGDGSIAKQISPFQQITADWNHDGDVYEQFGAWFESPHHGGNSFWTPEQLVRTVADGLDPERRFSDNEVKTVLGIEIPINRNRPKLEDTIRNSELRAANRDADRNRTMNSLGIRPSGEPWAR